MRISRLFGFIPLAAKLVVAAPAAMAHVPINDTVLSATPLYARGQGCGWSMYNKYWHGVPENSGENLDAGDCHSPPYAFRDYSIFDKCMCYFYKDKNCKGGELDPPHVQKWAGDKGRLNPPAKSYWCDWPQEKCVSWPCRPPLEKKGE